jgi:hypothetical protein
MPRKRVSGTVDANLNISSAQNDIATAKGTLGIMVSGMGAVATTLIAGVVAVRRGFAMPIGSMPQMGTIRLGKRSEDRTPPNWTAIRLRA